MHIIMELHISNLIKGVLNLNNKNGNKEHLPENSKDDAVSKKDFIKKDEEKLSKDFKTLINSLQSNLNKLKEFEKMYEYVIRKNTKNLITKIFYSIIGLAI